uniref:Uncharacterized protein n=1 Tax=uncultured nuHF1 cluster bacterium HF0130_31E21 TaxID=710728 RepID=E0XTL1_9BACT|nr:hypothetical protein [uncultured nuHF1 cluster bacterium HF0130_31E21]
MFFYVYDNIDTLKYGCCQASKSRSDFTGSKWKISSLQFYQFLFESDDGPVRAPKVEISD